MGRVHLSDRLQSSRPALKQAVIIGSAAALSFLIILLLINTVFIHLAKHYDSYYGNQLAYEKRLAQIPKLGNTVDFLFFGSSHTERDINLSYFPNSMGMQRSGGRYFEDYYILRSMVDNGLKVKYVVLEFDEHTMFDFDPSETILARKYYSYADFATISQLSSACQNCSNIQLWFNKELPVIGRGDELSVLLLTQFGQNFSRGHGNWSQSTTKLDDARLTWASFHPSTRAPIGDVTFEYLQKIMNFSRANNITVVLVKYPVSPEYDQAVRETGFNKTSFYEQLAQKLNSTESNAPYFILDYQEKYYGNYDVFDDPHHLNYAGSNTFSRQLYQDIIEQSNNSTN